VRPTFPTWNSDPPSATTANTFSLLPSIPKRPSTVQEQKLRRAATEFESILISTFWKSMKESFALDDDDSSDPGGSTFEDMGIQSMSQALSKAGGFGFGRLIMQHLQPYVEGADSAQRAPETR